MGSHLPWERVRCRPQCGPEIEDCEPGLRAFLSTFWTSKNVIFGLVRAEIEGNAQKGNSAYVANIIVETPQRGVGTAFMMWLCALADEFGTQLTLKVSPIAIDGLPRIPAEKLAEWYTRFGFTGSIWLSRAPRRIEKPSR